MCDVVPFEHFEPAESIEKLCEYLLKASEREGAGMWQTVDSPERTVMMGAILQGDRETIEKVKNNPDGAREEILEWLAISGARHVADFVQKYFYAMYAAYLEGREKQLVYVPDVGLREIRDDNFVYSKPEDARKGIVLAKLHPKKTPPLSSEEAAERVNNNFKEYYTKFIHILSELTRREESIRLNLYA